MGVLEETSAVRLSNVICRVRFSALGHGAARAGGGKLARWPARPVKLPVLYLHCDLTLLSIKY